MKEPIRLDHFPSFRVFESEPGQRCKGACGGGVGRQANSLAMFALQPFTAGILHPVIV